MTAEQWHEETRARARQQGGKMLPPGPHDDLAELRRRIEEYRVADAGDPTAPE